MNRPDELERNTLTKRGLATPYRQALNNAWEWAHRAEQMQLGSERDDAIRAANMWAAIARAERG